MDRRDFLTTSAGIGIVSLSGCLGYRVVESSDVKQRKRELRNKEEKVQELNEKIENLNSKIDTKNNQISELESNVENKNQQIESLQGEVEDLEAEKEQQVKKFISTTYDDGLRFENVASDEYSRGKSEYDSENFTNASRLLSAAFAHFDSATEFFYLAGQKCRDNGYSEAESICVDSNNYAVNMADASDHFALAASYYATGDTSNGDTQVEQGNTDYNTAQDYSVESLGTLQTELGL